MQMFNTKYESLGFHGTVIVNMKLISDNNG